MRHKCGGVHRERARYLHGICQFQAKRSPQPRGALCNVDVELDKLSRLKDSSITPRERLIGYP